VIDGELAALDEQGRPRFNLLQNFRSASSHITLYAFDILFHGAKTLCSSRSKNGERSLHRHFGKTIM
jgi:ATP-dependent DNA ligase